MSKEDLKAWLALQEAIFNINNLSKEKIYQIQSFTYVNNVGKRIIRVTVSKKSTKEDFSITELIDNLLKHQDVDFIILCHQAVSYIYRDYEEWQESISEQATSHLKVIKGTLL